MQAFRALSTCMLAFAASCLHSFVTTEDLKLEARLPPVYKAKNLVMYDHGEGENHRRYGQATPPQYPRERIRLPIALFSSHGDILADTSDVADLAYRLSSNLVLNYIVPQPSFCHQDFVSGNRANDILHNIVIELAKKYSSQNP